MEDKTINCCDCKNDFVWTVKEQTFFKEKNIEKEPVRCRKCAIALMKKKKGENNPTENDENK